MDRHLLGEGAYGLSYRGGEFAQEEIKPRCGGVQNCEDTIVYSCKVLNYVSGNGYFNCREDLSKWAFNQKILKIISSSVLCFNMTVNLLRKNELKEFYQYNVYFLDIEKN